MTTMNQTVKRDVWITLSEADKAERADQMADYDSKIADLESELKEISGDLKSQIKTLKAERGAISKAVREGKEQRLVDVEMRHDYQEQRVRFFYNGDEVGNEPMTDDHRQMELDSKAEAVHSAADDNHAETPEADQGVAQAAEVEAAKAEETSEESLASL